MSAEELHTQTPAIDRLKAVLFPQMTQRDLEAEARHRLEDGTTIRALYYKSPDSDQQVLRCSIGKERKLLLEFSLGQDTLESIGTRTVAFSFGDSERVRIGLPGVGIGIPRECLPLNVHPDDLEKLVSVGEGLADWITQIMQENKVTNVPFQITTGT
jgi:hypothetical protein